MPEIKVEDVTKVLKDALYVSVGLSVIAFQKAQVQRTQLTKQLKEQLGDARGQVQSLAATLEDRFKVLEERLQGVESRFDSVLDQLEDRLPEQAREIAKQAREAAREARTQARAVVSRGAA